MVRPRDGNQGATVDVGSEMRQTGSEAWGAAIEAPPDALVAALGPLLDQLAHTDAALSAARDGTTWTGPAAEAFQATALRRSAQLHDLMRQVQEVMDRAEAAARVGL